MLAQGSARDQRPLVGLTLGDPAGIGPEVVVRALENPAVAAAARVVVIGESAIVERARAAVRSSIAIRSIGDPAAGRYEPGTLDLLETAALGTATISWGAVQPDAGRAAFAYVRRGIELCLQGRLEALATAPINKEALRLGGVPFLDHTAMLKALTASPDLLTMFTIRGRNLRIFFMARHASLRQSCDEVTEENVYLTLRRADAALKRFGLQQRRIAVAALNPHAGEHGLFGDEEITQIAPAIARAQAEGIDARGPVPADAVFHQMLQGRYDAVVSLYHDQGHIAAKTLDFERTVSVTTGLPFLRTSVDHGTAFDIAGKGVASAVSIEEAILVAAELAPLLRARET